MSLGWKFFLTYVAVAASALLVLAVSTSFVAPETFSDHMRSMSSMQDSGMMMGQSARGQQIEVLDVELDASFREAVNSALLRAGIAAILAAAVVSWIVTQRIMRPIHTIAEASQQIAEGQYEQRITRVSRDELGDMVDSFNRMAAALAGTESMRQQLIADVSHELKTPLASIKGYMEGLQDGVIPATPETYQLVHREADRLQRLVHDLQEVSRAEAGAVPLIIHPHAPIELVSPVVARLQPQFADKNVALTVDLPPVLPVVCADADRIEQVLTNLLGNALQYTPDRGVVTVSARTVDDRVQFSVRDTGIGLGPDDLTRIFQRFYRVDKSRSRAGGGSGIGLTIARHIVEAHGGSIWAESPGLYQGSTFYFTLPTP